MNFKEILSFNSHCDDLSLDHEDQVFLENLAKKIHDHGMVTPAVFLLEMSKPLSLLGSHFLVFFGPIINAFLRAENYYKTVQIFENPKNVEILLKNIEKLDRNA